MTRKPFSKANAGRIRRDERRAVRNAKAAWLNGRA